ncbi:MAG: family 2 glycosyl transferase [Elusimicrobia bacterium]|nr:MAG: family 2 glycosyl transferase [Elusimicrobiota bacterium]KAF0157334.1 MAG: family 2 glycosyl transferase [Elusimicrobiota bacterium]
MKVSIVIPAYNEMRTLPAVLERLKALPLDKEVVVVDDGSSDGSREWLDEAIAAKRFPYELRLIKHERNRGKGGALITAFGAAAGEAVIVQDADLEYDPLQIPEVVLPIAEGRADAVFGSRMLSGRAKTYSQLYLAGNKFLSLLVSALFGVRMTDSYTCYKAFRTAELRRFALSSTGFEIEAELACKTAFLGLRFMEVPIAYSPRSREDGKKINFRDAVKGVLKILGLRLALRRGDFGR